MKPDVCWRAMSELAVEGWRVSWVVLGVSGVSELLGEGAAYQAEAAYQDGHHTVVGEIHGIRVVSGRASNSYFAIFKQAEEEGGVCEAGSDRRYFQVAGDCLVWLTADPVRVVVEGCEARGWRPTWVRLADTYGEQASREGVEVWVGDLSPRMVLAGDGTRVGAVMFDEDGIWPVWLGEVGVGGEALEGVLVGTREHVGWTGHRSLTVDRWVQQGFEGAESRIGCGECGWWVGLTELMCGGAGRWDLLSEAGLCGEVERLAGTAEYERPSVWGRLGGGFV